MEKHTHVVYTGGTFLSEESEKGEGRVSTSNLSQLKKKYGEIQDKFNFDEELLFSIDSSDSNPQSLKSIQDHILHMEDVYPNKYSSYVVVHGTDTLEYTGAFISFVCSHVKKPIILTGSMKSVNDEDTDALNNLFNAIHFAQEELHGTFISFGDSLLQSNKSVKKDPTHFNAFSSNGYPHIAKIETLDDISNINKNIVHNNIEFYGNKIFGYNIDKSLIDQLKYVLNKNKNKSLQTINPNVGLVKLYPGFQISSLDYYIDKKIDGIVIEGYGDGNIPQESLFFKKIKKLIENGALVVLKSQCNEGGAHHKYAGGKKAIELGAISGRNLTTSSAIMKLMLTLGEKTSSLDLKSLKNIYTNNHAGEYL